ncbi:MAG: hypothetical protein GY915_05720 [bacterium]|nr:hypothetical protein [bacterium]
MKFICKRIGILFFSVLGTSSAFSSALEDEGDFNACVLNAMESNLSSARKGYEATIIYEGRRTANERLEKIVCSFRYEKKWEEFLISVIKPISSSFYDRTKYKKVDFVLFSKGAKKAFVNSTGMIANKLEKLVKEARESWFQKNVITKKPFFPKNTAFDSDHWMRTDS